MKKFLKSTFSSSHAVHEQLWIKCWGCDKNHLYGKGLNDPYHKLSVKKDDIVEMYIVSHGDLGDLIVRLDRYN